MAIIAVSTGKTLVKTEEKKLFGLEDKSAEVGQRRPVKLKGVNIAAKTKGVTLFLDGKEGKVVYAAWTAAEGQHTEMFNRAGESAGPSDGIEISTGELCVENVTSSQENYITAFIEE